MKQISVITLLVLIAGTQAFAQLSPEKALSTYNKVKAQYDELITKWKPLKDQAMANVATLSPELKSSIEKVDADITSFGTRLSSFPTASAADQATMAASLKDDFSKLKSSVSDVTKQINKLKLAKM